MSFSFSSLKSEVSLRNKIYNNNNNNDDDDNDNNNNDDDCIGMYPMYVYIT